MFQALGARGWGLGAGAILDFALGLKRGVGCQVPQTLRGSYGGRWFSF
jgi:hypothetical protein